MFDWAEIAPGTLLYNEGEMREEHSLGDSTTLHNRQIAIFQHRRLPQRITRLALERRGRFVVLAGIEDASIWKLEFFQQPSDANTA